MAARRETQDCQNEFPDLVLRMRRVKFWFERQPSAVIGRRRRNRWAVVSYLSRCCLSTGPIDKMDWIQTKGQVQIQPVNCPHRIA